MNYKKVNTTELKEQVIKEMSNRGVNVYIIDLYQKEGDYPYCVYTFDKDLLTLAREYYGKGRIIEGAYDDWSMDEDRYVLDLVETMMSHYQESK